MLTVIRRCKDRGESNLSRCSLMNGYLTERHSTIMDPDVIPIVTLGEYISP